MEETIVKNGEVEVTSEEERFKGAWHRAILEENPTESDQKKLKVRYLTLLNDDGSPLTGMIDRRFIRPVPPENPYDGVFLKEGSVVDADLKGGWCVGLVIKKTADNQNPKYLVYFDSPPNIIPFERRQLKAHLDWTGSKWVRPEIKKLVRSVFSSGTMVELREDLTWREVMIVKELDNKKRFIVKKFDNYSRKTKNESVDSLRVRPKQPPSLSNGEFKLLDPVEAYRDFVWRQGMVKEILRDGYIISFAETNEEQRFNRSELRLPMEWKDGVWHRRLEPMRNQNGVGNESMHNGRKRKTEEEDNTKVVLPFTKKSPVWKIYESMEVLEKIPQAPHFSPLFKRQEDFREGCALGVMAVFTGLLEKLKDLKTDVLISQLESLKGSFLKLEKHGFDITAPLSRIDKLSEIKKRQLSLLEEEKGFEKEKMDGSSEMRKADEEIDEIELKILELERQRVVRKEQKKMAYEKICEMESFVRDVGVKLKDVETEFETTVSAPW